MQIFRLQPRHRHREFLRNKLFNTTVLICRLLALVHHISISETGAIQATPTHIGFLTPLVAQKWKLLQNFCLRTPACSKGALQLQILSRNNCCKAQHEHSRRARQRAQTLKQDNLSIALLRFMDAYTKSGEKFSPCSTRTTFAMNNNFIEMFAFSMSLALDLKNCTICYHQLKVQLSFTIIQSNSGKSNYLL